MSESFLTGRSLASRIDSSNMNDTENVGARYEIPMFHTAELLARSAVHSLPRVHHSFACHSVGAHDDGEAADDDAVPVFGSGAGVTCVGGVEAAGKGNAFGAAFTRRRRF